VEKALLGENVSYNKPLASISLVPAARAKFGNATLVYNWNILHQWEEANKSTCSKWYLQQAGKHLLHPVYTSAIYKDLGDDNIDFEVKMQGKAMDNLFQICHRERDGFCDDDRSNATDSLWSSFFTPSETSAPTCAEFVLHNLTTVGQITSASSAAAGGASVHAWLQSIVEIVREKVKGTLKGPMHVLCSDIYKVITENLVSPCNREDVLTELYKFLGCETKNVAIEDSYTTAKRWSKFLRKMAIPMKSSSPLGDSHVGHMAIDAVRPNTHTHARTHKYVRKMQCHNEVRSITAYAYIQ